MTKRMNYSISQQFLCGLVYDLRPQDKGTTFALIQLMNLQYKMSLVIGRNEKDSYGKRLLVKIANHNHLGS